MNRSFSLGSALLALVLAGCSGGMSSGPAAVPVSAPTDSGSSPADVHVVVIDARSAAVAPGNSYAHILVRVVLAAVAPQSLSQELRDGASLTLIANGIDQNGDSYPLNGVTVNWTKPAHGTLVPIDGTAEADFRAPVHGWGSESISVSVTVPGRQQQYVSSATVSYAP